MTKSNGSLLSPEELAVCEKVYKSNENLHGLRAKVLLVLNEGMTQVKAADLTGLTIGQVRYCLKRFCEIRTGIFPVRKQTKVTLAEPKVDRKLAKSDSTAKRSVKKLNKTEDKKNKGKKKTKKKEKKKDKKPKLKPAKKIKSDKKAKSNKNKKNKKNKKTRSKKKNKSKKTTRQKK